MPLVSVIMPCFNHARYVGESIKSVLSQTERDLELIIVDDASTDGSRKIIEATRAGDERIKPIYHDTNQGASQARNSALKIASGKYIAFCDADDLWLPHKLEVQLEGLEPYPEVAVIYADSLIINGEGKPIGDRFSYRYPIPGNGSGYLFKTLCIRNFINIQSALLRRWCITEENYFDPNIQWVEDWWFWVQIAQGNYFIYNPEALGFYRVHERSSASSAGQRVDENRLKVYARILRAFPDLPLRTVSAIYYHMGVGLAKLGKRKDARDSYRHALQLNPINYRAAVRLTLCAIQK
jgi:glycosyltransferase involved in cell wall biosynthesis